MSENKDGLRKLIIIGSGPAGLTAAIYAARARLEPIVLAGEQFGGQLMNTTDVENYPGFEEGIAGPKLMMNMMSQAKKFGADVRFENADEVDFSGEDKTIKTRNGEYKAESIIIATGAMPRMMEVEGEKEFYGKGVSTCATCDGAFYKEKVVAVIGGGDSAIEEATFLTRFASKVYLIHRRDEFRASPIMVERARANQKVEIILNSQLRKVQGNLKVEKITVFNNKDNTEKEISVDGVFIAIGHIPVTGYLNGITLNEQGYILSKDGVHTNIEGVFVAGDVEDDKYRQAVTAAGSGCKAALEAQRWLEE
jgi:thioredoxin reductase (NADPH)